MPCLTEFNSTYLQTGPYNSLSDSLLEATSICCNLSSEHDMFLSCEISTEIAERQSSSYNARLFNSSTKTRLFWLDDLPGIFCMVASLFRMHFPRMPMRPLMDARSHKG